MQWPVSSSYSVWDCKWKVSLQQSPFLSPTSGKKQTSTQRINTNRGPSLQRTHSLFALKDVLGKSSFSEPSSSRETSSRAELEPSFCSLFRALACIWRAELEQCRPREESWFLNPIEMLILHLALESMACMLVGLQTSRWVELWVVQAWLPRKRVGSSSKRAAKCGPERGSWLFV